MNGYIKIPRSFFDSWIWTSGDPMVAKAFIDLVSMAKFKPTQVEVSGRVVTLQRGQLVGSVRFLAKRWEWPHAKTQRFIKKLRNDTVIDTQTDTGITIITICKYGPYQDEEPEAIQQLIHGSIRSRYTPDTEVIHSRYTNDTNKNKGIKKEGNKEKKGRVTHTHATNVVIEYLESNPDQLKLLCAGAKFSGDWRKVVIDFYRRKCDNQFLLDKAARQPWAHVGWIQGDMEKSKTDGSANKETGFSQVERIRNKYRS